MALATEDGFRCAKSILWEVIMRRITSKAHLDSLRQNRPEKTETWMVDPAATDVPSPKPRPSHRQMNHDEVREMATYLEVKADELDGPFYIVKDLSCPNCNRATTFLDFIKTAVDSGLHDKSLVRDVLCGRAGRWITIVGTSGDREVVCGSCNKPITRLRPQRPHDCHYETQWYRYDA